MIELMRELGPCEGTEILDALVRGRFDLGAKGAAPGDAKVDPAGHLAHSIEKERKALDGLQAAGKQKIRRRIISFLYCWSGGQAIHVDEVRQDVKPVGGNTTAGHNVCHEAARRHECVQI